MDYVSFLDKTPKFGAGDIDIYDESFGTVRHVQVGWYSAYINDTEMFYDDELVNSKWRYSDES